MIGFDLSTNYVENPEVLIWKTRARLRKSPKSTTGRHSSKKKFDTRV
jgi:hypothetical protein